MIKEQIEQQLRRNTQADKKCTSVRDGKLKRKNKILLDRENENGCVIKVPYKTKVL